MPEQRPTSASPSAQISGAAGNSRRPVAIDLFSGAGGLSLGFEQAGFDILASVEYDPVHAATHAFNFALTEVVCADLADSTAVNATRLRTAGRKGWAAHARSGKWDGELDVLIGGPPCQGFSTIGKRKVDDRRNQLVFRFAEFVTALRPRYFVMENVPGMQSFPVADDDEATLLLDVLLERFRASGYDVEPPRTLNAMSFGVPQDRERLILLGRRSGERSPAYPESLTRSRPRRVAACSPEREERRGPECPTVWDAIGDLPDLDAFSELLFTDEVKLTEAQHDEMRGRMSTYARILHGTETDPTDLSWPRLWDPRLLTSSRRTTHKPEVAERFASTPAGHAEPVSRFFRLAPTGVSSTLRAGTHYERGSFNAPRPIHPYLPRVLSVREAARLHSFPDWFRLHWTKWHGFRQVGNALPPYVGRAVGQQILRALQLTPAKPVDGIALGDSELLVMENLRAAQYFDADAERIPRNGLRIRAPKSANVAA